MALIKCPDCKSEISDSAKACPNCGCDFQAILRQIKQKREYIEYLEHLEKPILKSFSGLSILFYLGAILCFIGKLYIPPLSGIFLLIGGILLLSNILALIRGDVRKENKAKLNAYLQAKNSIPELKNELAKLEARFK